ncbi:hypothetical protein STCU_02379 [Strigomonas culicis]|uniref:SMP-LTD domain-containing protein n=1 Tax=Strigomonas culicis TaxID=28005 RepID=S9UWV7_9TRYP|nr:hypothetical protein STCU_02379 [Strigomonas culicis]|eukprot:EPY33249.1 hypothetical protein STCU_02379 [Strigomonas culicis]
MPYMECYLQDGHTSVHQVTALLSERLKDDLFFFFSSSLPFLIPFHFASTPPFLFFFLKLYLLLYIYIYIVFSFLLLVGATSTCQHMLYVVTFLYGAIGGAVCCLIFFAVAFNKLESFITNIIKKKALKHAAYVAVAKEAAVVPPAKVEALCRLVNFDHDVVGTVIQCRAVMYSNTMTFYMVDALDTLPDRRQMVQAEHLFGRINRSCVEVGSKKLSKYHRHINTDSLTASVKGKCIILTAKDGVPLFLPDAERLLQLRLNRIREEQQARSIRYHHHLHHSAGGGDSPTHLTEAAQPLAVSKDGLMHSFDKVGAAVAEEGEGPLALYNPTANKANPTPLDISTWRTIAIKFPTRRETERWLNLLQANARTEQFQEYLTHMPQRDVFNILITRLFFENTSSNRLHDILTEKIQDKFAAISRSLGHNVKGNIYLDGLVIGGEVPLISSVSEGTISPSGDFEFGFDILYRGGLVLLVHFAITYRDIKVPDIVFTIRVLELAGRMRMNIGPPHTHKFWLGCPRPPELRLDISQEVVKEGLLGNLISLLPDLGEIISNVVREKIFEDMILPKYDDFPWPSFDEANEEDGAVDDGDASDEMVSLSSRQFGGASASGADSRRSDKDKDKDKKKKRFGFFRSKKSKDGKSADGRSSKGGDDHEDSFSEGQSFRSTSISPSTQKKGGDKASSGSATARLKAGGKASPSSAAAAEPGIAEKKQDLIKDYLEGVLHDTVAPSLSRSVAEAQPLARSPEAGAPTYLSAGGAAVLGRSPPAGRTPGHTPQASPASGHALEECLNLSMGSNASADTFLSYGVSAVSKAKSEGKKSSATK